MEELSKDYIMAIAHSIGYFNSESRDYGTDLTIRKVIKANGRSRYITSGRMIDFQVKAVTHRFFTETENEIKYDLEVKNYADLIDRFEEKGALVPLILIVFIMPDNKDDRLRLEPHRLVLQRCAYWYRVNASSLRSENRSKIRITIPKTNLITSTFFPDIFEQTKNG